MFKSINVREIYSRASVQVCKTWKRLPAIVRKLITTCVILAIAYLAIKFCVSFWIPSLTGAETNAYGAFMQSMIDGNVLTDAQYGQFHLLHDKVIAFQPGQVIPGVGILMSSVASVFGIVKTWAKS